MNRSRVILYIGLLVPQMGFAAVALQVLNVPLVIITPVYMFTPAVAAVGANLLMRDSLSNLGLTVSLNRWYMVAWILPPALTAVTIFVGLSLPGINLSFTPALFEQSGISAGSPIAATAVLFSRGMLFGAVINTGFAAGEEVGWRGLLQPELDTYGFWKGSVAVGIVWGLWHAPLILAGHNYPNHPYLGMLLMILFTISLSPIFGYLRYRTQSTIGPSLAHGTLNSVAAVPLLLLTGGTNIVIGIQGISGIAVLGIANIALYIADRTHMDERLSNKRIKI
ncbi:lysostaphin resistance A-like protein [Halobaculum sp. MBLA0147]|uniref:CPBP family intramembrane glutamic endopeptidase n=1 Tax=Halobaculum sp. MBLA0147 TaxID=3079934 RepID=UPI0035241BB3